MFVEPDNISNPRRSLTTQGTSRVVESVETISIQKKKLNGYPSLTKVRMVISNVKRKKQVRMMP
jgi:hypothetical protein